MMKNKRDNCIMISGTIQQKDIKILSLCVLKDIASKYMKQKLANI